jgi:fibronectin-binding autotransporter adhesin
MACQARVATIALVSTLLALVTSNSIAATRTWDGGGGADNNWRTDANWSSNIEPDVGDTATFTIAATVGVTTFGADTDISTDRLRVRSNVTLGSGLASTADYVLVEPDTAEPTRGVIIGEQNGDIASFNMNLPHMTTAAATFGYLAGSYGTFNIGGGDRLTVNGSSAANHELIIGGGGTGGMTVSGGALVLVNGAQGDAAIGEYANSNGTVTVFGSSSVLNVSKELYVGYEGGATLGVTTGGVVYSGSAYVGTYATSIASVAVSGSAATWYSGQMYLGNLGRGTLQISSQGYVQTLSDASVGVQGSGIGEATITGAGSTWDIPHSGLFVGNIGSGTLTIASGGLAHSKEGYVGQAGGSVGEANIDGTGSKWTVDDKLYVGGAGSGTLRVTGGGLVTDVTGYVCNANGPTCSATVDGTGSTWTSTGGLYVGYDGNGAVQIKNGGRLNSNAAWVGYLHNHTSSVSVDGAASRWNNTGSLSVGNSESTGTLTVSNGGIVQSTTVGVGALGQLRGDGTVVGNVQNDGAVLPGNSPGRLTIDGNFVQGASGELRIELASALSFDQLQVTNQATLAGTLVVSLLGGYTPTVGQTFSIVVADDVDNTFATTQMPSLPNIQFEVLYNVQSVVVKVMPAQPGDFNLDTKVDAADYVLWRKNPGGVFTAADYDTWRTHFGQPPGSGAAVGGAANLANSAVPEPSSMLSVLAILGFLLSRARPVNLPPREP